jgi:hypothetical protein
MIFTVHFKDESNSDVASNAINCRRFVEEGSFVKCIQRWVDDYTEEERTREVFIPRENVIKIESS